MGSTPGRDRVRHDFPRSSERTLGWTRALFLSRLRGHNRAEKYMVSARKPTKHRCVPISSSKKQFSALDFTSTLYEQTTRVHWTETISYKQWTAKDKKGIDMYRVADKNLYISCGRSWPTVKIKTGTNCNCWYASTILWSFMGIERIHIHRSCHSNVDDTCSSNNQTILHCFFRRP